MAAPIVHNVADTKCTLKIQPTNQPMLLLPAPNRPEIKSIQVEKPVDLEFDLGNLLAYDINDFDINEQR